MKLWITARDDRVCEDCASLDGQMVEDDAYFILPNGLAVAGPFHLGCRCRIFQVLPPAPQELPPGQPASAPAEPEPEATGTTVIPPTFLWLDFGDVVVEPRDPAEITQADRAKVLQQVKELARQAVVSAAESLEQRRKRLQLRPPKPDLVSDDANPAVISSPAEHIKRGLRRKYSQQAGLRSRSMPEVH